MNTISFDVSREAMQLIQRIVERAEHLADQLGRPRPPRARLTMDLVACHAACPLQLTELLVAGPADFAHDVWGIHHHIDRRTGELRDCFFPRYARANNPLA